MNRPVSSLEAPLPAPPAVVMRYTQAASSAARIETLDGLRAISIVAVLIGHGACTGNAPQWLYPLRDLGIVGVYVFFTISGFIITLLMLRERERKGSVSLSAFWSRRALRILPPFLAACAGIAVASAAGLLPWDWPSFLSALTFTKNTHWLHPDWFFGHFWSLSMEEQFYLLWPLAFVWLIHRQRAVAALSLLALSSPMLAIIVQATYPTFDKSLPCLPYLSLGCTLAILIHRKDPLLDIWRGRRILRALALLVLGSCMLAADALKRDSVWPYLTTIVYACVVPLAAITWLAETVCPDGLLRPVMSWPPLRWLGLISYSVYLWQQLFLGRVEVYSKPWFWANWPQNQVAAVAAGALAYYLVEVPAAEVRRRYFGRS